MHATPEPVVDPGHGRARRVFGASIGLLNTAGTCLILLIMIIVCGDILGRLLVNKPLPGVPEIVAMSIVAIVFLQFAHTLATGNMIRSTVLLDALRRRSRRAASALEAVTMLAGAVAFALIAWPLSELAVDAFLEGDQYGAPGVFLFPKWPVRALALGGAVATCVQFLLQAGDAFREFRSEGTGSPATYADLQGEVR